MLRFFPLLWFSVAVIQVNAQSFRLGINGGLTLNRVSTNISNLPLTKIRGGFGYLLGLKLSYNTDKFAVCINPGFVQKNYEQYRTGTLSGIFDSYKNGYLQLPVYTTYRVTYKKTAFSLNTGLYSGYWVSQKVVGTTINIYNSQIINGSLLQSYSSVSYSSKVPFDERRDNRFEFGYLVGAGVSRNFKEYTLSLEYNFMASLVDKQKDYMLFQSPRFNQTSCLIFSIVKEFTL